MSMQVKYYDIPVGMQQDLHITGQGQPFSDPQKLSAGTADLPYATLEEGIWRLDGSCILCAQTPGDCWWSRELSDAEGVFATPPVLELTFSNVYTSTGITFTFWPVQDQWCSELEIAWYRGDTLLWAETTHPDAPRWELDRTVQGFNRIRITLKRTNRPHQFAKLRLLQIGRVTTFERDALETVNLLHEADPMLCTLTADTMTINLYLRQPRELIPQENQKLELYRDGVLLDTQYIVSSDRRSSRQYTLKCQSAIGLLEDTFLGGFYTDTPLAELVGQILPGWQVEIHPDFAQTTVCGYLGVSTRREALQQLAFAIGAVVKTQGSAGIVLQPVRQTLSGQFTRDVCFTGASIETAPRYACIQVSAHSYAPTQEVKTLLDNERLQGQDILFTFQEPYHSYTVSGGVITDSGPNFVTITANGAVTLTAKGYLHSSVVYSYTDPTVTGTKNKNVFSVDGATLVTTQNVQQVLERLSAAAQNRQKLQLRAVIDGQQVGDLVLAQNPWDSQIRGYIASMDSVVTDRGHTAQVVIWGMEMPADSAGSEPENLYDGEEVAH